MTLTELNDVLSWVGIPLRIVRPKTTEERVAADADPNIIVADSGEAGMMVAIAELKGRLNRAALE